MVGVYIQMTEGGRHHFLAFPFLSQARLPKSSALREHTLAERVDVPVGRLPQAKYRLCRGAADQRDVRRHGRHQARRRRRYREGPPHRARAARKLQFSKVKR